MKEEIRGGTGSVIKIVEKKERPTVSLKTLVERFF